MSKAIPEPKAEDTGANRADAEKDSVARAWDEYKASGRESARDALILNYSPLVKYAAGRVAVGLPANIEQADLISYGIFGLIDAIDKYDQERGIKFETYAISRIRGAIIDELRAIDWVPRSVRFKAREIEKAYTALENKMKRPPSDAEVAEEMGISLDELPRGPRRADDGRLGQGRPPFARRHPRGHEDGRPYGGVRVRGDALDPD